MIRKAKKTPIPDLTEFTDDEGKKWIQTSTEDLFSVRELNEVLDSIEKDKDSGEIVLARIDFRRVNKEYYETVQELQATLKKRNAILKKLIVESKTVIDRKNRKLKELIEYIKKLHVLLAYYKLRPEDFEKIDFSVPVYAAPPVAIEPREEEPIVVVEYTEVQEKVLDDSGEEAEPVNR
ncbi:MAG: hypothetical protein AB2L13_16655 [Spirochaetota bacterium]